VKSRSSTTRPRSNSNASAAPGESGAEVIASVYENRGGGATVMRFRFRAQLATSHPVKRELLRLASSLAGFHSSDKTK
jgi:hypothetical protein